MLHAVRRFVIRKPFEGQNENRPLPRVTSGDKQSRQLAGTRQYSEFSVH